ncbi:hypothetical protein N7495_008842 [Penicillium taxi]|uniref:uncharacterized protein n=1 Tax=Penicillium taxi TaxID=168475 RepID=UPI0025452164|nr:uncharacterized protein N7495_008842 [Penicillium taxi]KAJ5888801.1 hypothetical protein N7495_008842 [Penicillium taxi]
MTGIFTYRNFSLHDTPALDGKVAVVTKPFTPHGKNGNTETESISENMTPEWNLCNVTWAIFTTSTPPLNISSKKTDKVDILICNAGLGVPYQFKRSPHNIDRIFATNCIGHFVLVTRLLPLLRNAASSTSSKVGSRVIFTSSSLHMLCREIDFELLASPSRVKWPVLFDGMWRYGRSQLGNILLAKEFSRRLQDESEHSHPSSENIYVNSYFPGNIVTNQWNDWSSYFGSFIGSCMRVVGRLCGQTVDDGAATAIYLATSDQVRDRNLRGRYFLPVATPGDPSPMAQDPNLGSSLWDWIETHVAQTLGSKEK